MLVSSHALLRVGYFAPGGESPGPLRSDSTTEHYPCRRFNTVDTVVSYRYVFRWLSSISPTLKHLFDSHQCRSCCAPLFIVHSDRCCCLYLRASRLSITFLIRSRTSFAHFSFPKPHPNLLTHSLSPLTCSCIRVLRPSCACFPKVLTPPPSCWTSFAEKTDESNHPMKMWVRLAV